MENYFHLIYKQFSYYVLMYSQLGVSSGGVSLNYIIYWFIYVHIVSLLVISSEFLKQILVLINLLLFGQLKAKQTNQQIGIKRPHRFYYFILYFFVTFFISFFLTPSNKIKLFHEETSYRVTKYLA